MGANAAQHFMNIAQFHSTLPILVITKIFGYYLKLLIKISKHLHADMDHDEDPIDIRSSWVKRPKGTEKISSIKFLLYPLWIFEDFLLQFLNIFLIICRPF